MIDHISPTQIESFDSSTTWGCPRKWWFDRRMPRPPADKNLMLGTAVHSTLEDFLKGGPQGGLHEVVIQAPGALEFLLGLRKRIKVIEKKIEPGELLLAGVPVAGRIDWVAGSPDEVGDHKTTSSIARYAKTSGQLRESTQMNIYAATIDVHDLKITQDFYQTKGAKKFEAVSCTTTKPFIRERICKIESVVEAMVQADKANKPEDVIPDETKCNIGFGCPHRNYCPRSGDINMASLLDMFKVIPPTQAETALIDYQKPESTPQPVVGTPPQVPVGALPPDAPKSDPALASAGPKVERKLVVSDDEPVNTDTEKPRRGRPPGAGNKPKPMEVIIPPYVPATPQSGPIQIERITLRHGAKIGRPNFSSATVEVEMTALVTGGLEAAKEALSLQCRTVMVKELSIYDTKGDK